MRTARVADTRDQRPDGERGQISPMARRARGKDKPTDKPKTRSPLFYFLGPPDLGDPNEPPRETGRVLMDCASCGRPMSEHTIDRSHGKSLTFCPPAAPDKDSGASA